MAGREDVGFESGGERCVAWLYRPDGEGPHPCVVLAHGFGGTRKGRLWAYAERFQEAGIAALVFDYRHFGDSSGEPRQLLSIGRQLDDWRAAIAYARGLEGVDPERIALWGTSFSGGHVVGLAAEDDRVAAVISQVPFTNGVAALRAAGPVESARLTVAGIIDLIAAATGSEARIPIVAPPGGKGAMSQPTAYDGYRALFDDPDRDFRNEFCARAGLALGGYAPSRKAADVSCPLLVCVLADDDITPAGPARAMAERAPRGELIDYGPGLHHFSMYVGEPFERTIVHQIDFLRRSLGLEAAVPTP